MSETKPDVTIDDIDEFIKDPQNAELAKKISKAIETLKTIEVADHLMGRVVNTEETPGARKRILLILHNFMPNFAENFNFYKKVLHYLTWVIETLQWNEAVIALNIIAKCGTDLHAQLCNHVITRANEFYANGHIAKGLQLIKSLEGIIEANILIDFIKQHAFTEEGIKLCLTVLDSSPGIDSVSDDDFAKFLLNEFFFICPSECSKILSKIKFQIDYSLNQELIDKMSMSPAAYHIAKLRIRLPYSEILLDYVIQVIMMNLENVKSVEAFEDVSDEEFDKDLKRDIENLFALIQKVSDAIDDEQKEGHFHKKIEQYWSMESFKLAAALFYGFVCRNKGIIPETDLIQGFDKETKFMLAAMFNIEEKLAKYVEIACELAFDEDINYREVAYKIFSRLHSPDLVQQVFDRFTALLAGIEEVDPDKLPHAITDSIELTLVALDALPAGFEMSSDILNKMLDYYLYNKIDHHFVHYLLRIQSKFNSFPRGEYWSCADKLYEKGYIDEVLILYRNNKLQIEQCNFHFDTMFKIIDKYDFELTRQDKTWILGMCKYGGKFNPCAELYVGNLTKHFVKTLDNQVAAILLVGASLIYERRFKSLKDIVLSDARQMMEQTKDIDFSDISPDHLLECLEFICQYDISRGTTAWEYLNQILITLISKNIKTAFDAFDSIHESVALKNDVKIALDQSIENYKDDEDIIRKYENLKNSKYVTFFEE